MSVRPLSRVDLYRIMRAHPADSAVRLARFLEYDWVEPDSEPGLTQGRGGAEQVDSDESGGGVVPAPPELEQRTVADLPFFIPSRLTFRGPDGPDKADQTPKELPPPPADAWTKRPTSRPPLVALQPQASLEALLRGIVERGLGTGSLDLGRTVNRLAKGETLAHFPRKVRRQQAGKILLLCDRSRHLAPYWADQEQVISTLRHCAPDANIIVRSRNALFEDPANFDMLDEFAETDICLALSDFGALGGDERLAKQWIIIARTFAQGHAFGLTMAPIERIVPDIRSHWRLIGWEEAPRDPSASADELASAEQILALLAPAFYLTPAMVRAVRHRFCPEAPAHVEALAWQHPWLETADPVSACFTVQDGERLRSQFATLEDASARAALAIIRESRFARDGISLGHDFWFPEILNLCPRQQSVIENPSDLDEARDYYARLAATAAGPGSATLTTLAYLSRCGTRAPQAVANDSGFRSAVWIAKQGDPEFLPPVTDPKDLLSLGDDIGAIHVTQVGDRLCLDRTVGAQQSPISSIASANGVVTLLPVDPVDRLESAKDAPPRPRWAQRFGTDQYGKWAELVVNNVTQRLRWIPAGRFLMGSPEYEPERWDVEGPQTEISFVHGYWLFDTPVTQALWHAVMGDSPSHFEGDDLPVEQVSFAASSRFIRRLNASYPGLDLQLPSEAQWEYACRAGRTSRYYFGDEARPDQIHFNTEATIAVKAKPPNAWGLYQMHGNVWEWCADIWHPSHEGADANGAPREGDSQSGGQKGVVRGGSWDDSARRVRAACRFGFVADFAYYYLGFRCAAVQSGPEAPAAEPQLRRGAASSSSPGREAAGLIDRGRVSVARPQTSLTLPQAPFIIRTDRADLEVARITKADLGWASGLGRDRFGLWADLTVDAVTQRLRWIPPGRFLMGSPEDEPGRWDDEGPQTMVTIETGYWLFDTPVTQGLWQVAMGNNPSRFVSKCRPVEQVSWDDTQQFIARMNERFATLGLHLPSEAQWEYACRGGTTDTTYAGPVEVVGVNNAPILDAIAWYGGNSGDGFELNNGIYSRGWSQTQYPQARAGTRIVKAKLRNAYGLYDMLGNVGEWCSDVWHPSHLYAAPDAAPRQSDPQSGEQPRVVRGGSWNVDARYVRAAYRNGNEPGNANFNLGFRCVAGQHWPFSGSS